MLWSAIAVAPSVVEVSELDNGLDPTEGKVSLPVTLDTSTSRNYAASYANPFFPSPCINPPSGSATTVGFSLANTCDDSQGRSARHFFS
jgi:hypothetical protein